MRPGAFWERLDDGPVCVVLLSWLWVTYSRDSSWGFVSKAVAIASARQGCTALSASLGGVEEICLCEHVQSQWRGYRSVPLIVPSLSASRSKLKCLLSGVMTSTQLGLTFDPIVPVCLRCV